MIKRQQQKTVNPEKVPAIKNIRNGVKKTNSLHCSLSDKLTKKGKTLSQAGRKGWKAASKLGFTTRNNIPRFICNISRTVNDRGR